MNYYISDLHLMHKNCIGFDERPFADLEEMHETILANWNRKVTNSDTVYILGDAILYGKKEDAIETYQALINYDKKNAQAYFLLGELYRKENDMDKAKENFNLAAQYAGTDYEMYIALYQECYAAGMQTEGQEYLKKRY